MPINISPNPSTNKEKIWYSFSGGKGKDNVFQAEYLLIQNPVAKLKRITFNCAREVMAENVIHKIKPAFTVIAIQYFFIRKR